jgi:N-acetylneuraminate synthase
MDVMAIFVIAEAGVNHNGDPDMAERLVDAALSAGADAVKFQTFRTADLVTIAAPKADYQKEHVPDGVDQAGMLKGLELDHEAFFRLKARAREGGIELMSTPFDPNSLDFLVDELGMARLKISSGDLTNGPLLLKAAQSGLPIILSTGMGTLDEIEQALAVLAYGYLSSSRLPQPRDLLDVPGRAEARDILLQRVTLLHCTTEYPAPVSEVNLRAMDTMRDRFGLSVGYSDHTEGIAVSIAAAARGAAVVEKHFTLDRNLPGPDHAASLELDEFKKMVQAIRVVEQAMGDGAKKPTEAERKNIYAARRGLVAARHIRSGELISVDDLVAKRPADGITPMRLWELLGTPSPRDFEPDEPFQP